MKDSMNKTFLGCRSMALVLAAFFVAASVNSVSAGGAAVSMKDLPDLFGGDYKVDTYIRAAITLQAMGRDAACAALLKLAEEVKEPQDIDDDIKIIALCRMVFAKRAGTDFRRAGIGDTHFMGGTDYSDWPLEPIELVDGIPFSIAAGRSLRGYPERAESYIHNCMANCNWNSYQFKTNTDAEKQVSLEKLLASPKWKKPLTERDKKFFASQIERIGYEASNARPSAGDSISELQRKIDAATPAIHHNEKMIPLSLKHPFNASPKIELLSISTNRTVTIRVGTGKSRWSGKVGEICENPELQGTNLLLESVSPKEETAVFVQRWVEVTR